LFNTAARELGPIAGLVNSAGVVGGLTRVENVTAAALEEVFRVNVIGTILCCPKRSGECRQPTEARADPS
jgi:NAD(P)-dependent dehydrogenase (short-subunit alcohol dehydrogenase family)